MMTINNDTIIAVVSLLSKLIGQRSTEYNKLSIHAVKSANQPNSLGRPLPNHFTYQSLVSGWKQFEIDKSD